MRSTIFCSSAGSLEIDSNRWWTMPLMGKPEAGAESQSGLGSYLCETEGVRAALPILTRELDVLDFLDAPCGDFNWMKEVDLGVRSYVGFDISLDIIHSN